MSVHFQKVPDEKHRIHVRVEYRTTGGSCGAWSAWAAAPTVDAALHAGMDKVRAFKRCARIDQGSAIPQRGAWWRR